MQSRWAPVEVDVYDEHLTPHTSEYIDNLRNCQQSTIKNNELNSISWRGDKEAEATEIGECKRFKVKKDRSFIINKTYQMIILPLFYQSCFQNLLTPKQYKMLEILIMLLQFHKTVTIEKLSSVFPQPIKFESRRRSILHIFTVTSVVDWIHMVSPDKTMAKNQQVSFRETTDIRHW